MEDLLPTSTIYSVIWPETRILVRRILQEDTDALMARHERAFEKRQDPMHEDFFKAWQGFAAPHLQVDWSDFPERYPSAGSSEAIREVLGQARATNRDLVVFEGEYEGYEALAGPAGTRIHRLDRRNWRAQIKAWRDHGAPWSGSGAWMWLSQPSGIDGRAWPDYEAFLQAVSELPNFGVWVDLAYLGLVPDLKVRLNMPVAQGVAFSLSKSFGTYYRRIGGLFARQAVPGLWGNRWFKSLDALYIGQRLLEHARDAQSHAVRLTALAQPGQQQFQSAYGEAFARAGVIWRPSQVPMVVEADALLDPTLPPALAPLWQLSRRGSSDRPAASRRLCITPFIEAGLEPSNG